MKETEEIKNFKPVQLMGNGKTYILDFDRESVLWAEETLDFSIDDLKAKKPLSSTSKLFYIAFHRRYPDEFTKEETDTIFFDEIPADKRQEIITSIIGLYVQTYNTLFDTDEDEAKNSKWSVKL